MSLENIEKEFAALVQTSLIELHCRQMKLERAVGFLSVLFIILSAIEIFKVAVEILHR